MTEIIVYFLHIVQKWSKSHHIAVEFIVGRFPPDVSVRFRLTLILYLDLKVETQIYRQPELQISLRPLFMEVCFYCPLVAKTLQCDAHFHLKKKKDTRHKFLFYSKKNETKTRLY